MFLFIFIFQLLSEKEKTRQKDFFRSINVVLRTRIHRIHVFRPRGCGSSCQRYGFGSRSGSIKNQNQICKNGRRYCSMSKCKVVGTDICRDTRTFTSTLLIIEVYGYSELLEKLLQFFLFIAIYIFEFCAKFVAL
jgi:hypothetical protein